MFFGHQMFQIFLDTRHVFPESSTWIIPGQRVEVERARVHDPRQRQHDRVLCRGLIVEDGPLAA